MEGQEGNSAGWKRSRIMGWSMIDSRVDGDTWISQQIHNFFLAHRADWLSDEVLIRKIRHDKQVLGRDWVFGSEILNLNSSKRFGNTSAGGGSRAGSRPASATEGDHERLQQVSDHLAQSVDNAINKSESQLRPPADGWEAADEKEAALQPDETMVEQRPEAEQLQLLLDGAEDVDGTSFTFQQQPSASRSNSKQSCCTTASPPNSRPSSSKSGRSYADNVGGETFLQGCQVAGEDHDLGAHFSVFGTLPDPFRRRSRRATTVGGGQLQPIASPANNNSEVGCEGMRAAGSASAFDGGQDRDEMLVCKRNSAPAVVDSSGRPTPRRDSREVPGADRGPAEQYAYSGFFHEMAGLQQEPADRPTGYGRCADPITKQWSSVRWNFFRVMEPILEEALESRDGLDNSSLVALRGQFVRVLQTFVNEDPNEEVRRHADQMLEQLPSWYLEARAA
eukprot:g84.t1